MPKYRFRHKNGLLTTHVMSREEFTQRVKNGRLRFHGKLSKKTVTLEFVEEVGGTTTGNYSACWPMVSERMGVDVSQVKSAMEYDARLGIPTDYNANGDPILTGPEHRKRYAEAHGFYDRNGGLSDPQRYSRSEHEARALGGNAIHKLDD